MLFITRGCIVLSAHFASYRVYMMYILSMLYTLYLVHILSMLYILYLLYMLSIL